ncbi:hypothetical protein BDF22DRAFT_734917 [Syncephalis plumigaleata]|nr:hypothetical protein BDF22DRAFT_734917 [Syncephalis plumigaleata]
MFTQSKGTLALMATSLLVVMTSMDVVSGDVHMSSHVRRGDSGYKPSVTGPIGYDEATNTFYGQKLQEANAFGKGGLMLEQPVKSTDPKIRKVKGSYHGEKVELGCIEPMQSNAPPSDSLVRLLKFYQRCLTTENTVANLLNKRMVGCPVFKIDANQGHTCYTISTPTFFAPPDKKIILTRFVENMRVNAKFINDIAERFVHSVAFLASLGFYFDFYNDKSVQISKVKYSTVAMPLVTFTDPSKYQPILNIKDVQYLTIAKRFLIRFYMSNKDYFDPSVKEALVESMAEQMIAGITPQSLQDKLQQGASLNNREPGSSPLKTMNFPSQ